MTEPQWPIPAPPGESDMPHMNFESYLRGYGRAGGEWLEEDSGLRLYVCRSIMCSGGYEFSNLALPSHLRGKGIFREFILIYSYLPLRLINVVNERLRAWCDRNYQMWLPDVFTCETDPELPMCYSNPNFRAGVNVRALRSKPRTAIFEKTAEN